MRSALCPFVLASVALLVGGCGSREEATHEIPVQKGSIGGLEYEINDHIVTITDCDPSIAGKLEIPTTIETRPVSGIGRRAFEKWALGSVRTAYEHGRWHATHVVNTPRGLKTNPYANCDSR